MTSPAVRQTGVVTSSTDCISSALMRSSCSPSRDRREHRVDVLHEIPGLGVEQHVLLLDAERVRIARAERVVEHARSRAADARRALAGDRRREDLLHVGQYHRLGLDLDEPARVEQLRDDPGRRRPRRRERLAVRAADLVDQCARR